MSSIKVRSQGRLCNTAITIDGMDIASTDLAAVQLVYNEELSSPQCGVSYVKDGKLMNWVTRDGDVLDFVLVDGDRQVYADTTDARVIEGLVKVLHGGQVSLVIQGDGYAVQLAKFTNLTQQIVTEVTHVS